MCCTIGQLFLHQKFTLIETREKTFADLVQNGKNIIFLNLIFEKSTSKLFPLKEIWKQWVWVAEAYQYLLAYSQDVDVFSLGLLKAEKDFLTIRISVENFTEACRLDVDKYLLYHFSHISEGNSTVSNTILKAPKGHLCFAKIERGEFQDFISDISGVKIGYPFWCYTDNNKSVFIGKSYTIYIVICIILCLYSFFPIFMEMAFYVEDRKADDRRYIVSDSPYSPSIIFLEDNKYFATLHILVIAIFLTTLVYYLKSETYNSSNCSLKLPNDNKGSPDVENFYSNSPSEFALSKIHFMIVTCCVFFKSGGGFDDFILLDFMNVCEHFFFMRTVPVSVFLPRALSKEKKKIMSFKIQKLSLLFSYKFWTKVLFIRRGRSRVKSFLLYHILCPIECVVNFGLVLGSILCPVVFTVYVFFVKYNLVAVISYVMKCCKKCCCKKYCCTKCCKAYCCKKCCKKCTISIYFKKLKWIRMLWNIMCHVSAIAYLYFVYTSSFNIFLMAWIM